MHAPPIGHENSYLVKTELGECDVHSRHLQELRGLAFFCGLLLVSGDLRAVFLSLRRGGDERDQEIESLSECGDVVVDLEEQVVLYFLGEADTGIAVVSMQLGVGWYLIHGCDLQNIALDVGGVEWWESEGHGRRCVELMLICESSQPA